MRVWHSFGLWLIPGLEFMLAVGRDVEKYAEPARVSNEQ